MTYPDKQPLLGRCYEVPTLRGIPVVPTVHTDAGVAQPHVHVDMRFVQKVKTGVYEAFFDNGGAMTIELGGDGLPHDTISGVACVVRYAGEDFEVRWLQCLQKHVWRGQAISGASNKPARPTCVGDRLYCPHAGADVTDLTPDGSGHARCPLHGQLLDMRR